MSIGILTKTDLTLLKEGRIPYVLLTDGYRLSINESGQIFISRGGKKQYYVSERLLNTMIDSKSQSSTKVLVEVVESLKELSARLNKKSRTRQVLDNLVEFILYGDGLNEFHKEINQ